MFDPLTALGLAGNLIQVIQFSYDLVSESNRIYEDAGGSLVRNKATEEVAGDLESLTNGLKARQDEWRNRHGATALDPDEARLRNLCERCIEVSLELQAQLTKLKVKEGQAKRLRSYKQALISVWRKDAIEEISQRLEQYQRELDTRVLLGIRQGLQDADVRHTEQFAALDQRTKDLAIAIVDSRGSFDTKLDLHTGALTQIASTQKKTHEMLQAFIMANRAPSPGPPPYDGSDTDASASTSMSGSRILHKASENGDIAAVRQLLRNTSLDVNARDEHGSTPLHVASNADVAKYLLRDKSVNKDAEDFEGRSALHVAVLKRRLDVIKVLLETHVDQSWQDDAGRPAEFYAKNCPAAAFMLRYGQDTEVRASDHLNNTSLLQLAWLGDVEGVEFYLSHKADVNARNTLGETALTEAARHGDVQIVEMLLRHKADPEYGANPNLEWTALLQAIRDGREQVVPVLLRHGARKDATLASGNNCLAEACWRKHFGIARLLIEDGANVNNRDLQKATPLFKASVEGDVEFVRWALTRGGAEVDTKNDASHTPLFEAAKRGHQEIVSSLLEAGASHKITVGSQHKWSPLGIAAKNGHDDSVRALLKRGADPNAKGNLDHTPLAGACSNGHPSILEALIAAGGDIEARVKSGFTPLAVAARSGHDECVRVLLAAGASLEARGFAHEK